jgi:hypothetical protein
MVIISYGGFDVTLPSLVFWYLIMVIVSLFKVFYIGVFVCGWC